jgi:hypothetical protein
VRFEWWSVSRNYREGPEAAIGSPIASEAAADPSVMKIHGGEEAACWSRPRRRYQVHRARSRAAGRGGRTRAHFRDELAIEVRGAIHNPDAPAELVPLTGVNVQKSIAGVGDGARFDPSNYVTAGLDVPAGMGFTKTSQAGRRSSVVHW